MILDAPKNRVVALDPAGRILLVKRPARGLLAGMWEFPSARLTPTPASPADRRSLTKARATRPERAAPTPTALAHLATLGYHGHAAASLAPVRHAFTHLRATYHPVVIRCGPDRRTRPGAPTTAWVHPARLDEWALPVAQQRIGVLLTAWIAGNRPRASG